MRALGFEVKKAQVLEIMREYDKQNTGYIGYDDFLEISKTTFLLLSSASLLSFVFLEISPTSSFSSLLSSGFSRENFPGKHSRPDNNCLSFCLSFCLCISLCLSFFLSLSQPSTSTPYRGESALVSRTYISVFLSVCMCMATYVQYVEEPGVFHICREVPPLFLHVRGVWRFLFELACTCMQRPLYLSACFLPAHRFVFYSPVYRGLPVARL